VLAAGGGNRNNRLRSKQDIQVHEIILRHNLWKNTAAFWVLKGSGLGGFRPPYLTLNVAPDVVCALYCDSIVLAISVLRLSLTL
jgi:hypothetical protein